MITSALYVGRVGHTRLRPRRHTLGYRSFMLLIDLEEAEALAGRLRWFSLDRFNLFGFRARDHGDGSSTPLRAQIAAHLEAAGLGASLGAVRLLCLPRVLGYVFNPISLYFCHSAAGELIAILYEVSSTFGERHSYLAAVDGPERPVRQTADKRLHVSPFMPMALVYGFRVQPPEETIRVAVDVRDEEGALMNASFVGRRVALSDASLVRVFATHPFQTLTVMAAIHWEAMRLMLKGMKLRRGPRAPDAPVSLGRPAQAVRR